MSKQRWRLVVSDLGSDAPVGEATVEADNWMQAVEQGRAELGEEAAVPRGATCRVAPGGDVTLIDPVSQRRYRVSRATEASFAPRRPGGPKVPADQPPATPADAARPSASSAPSKKKPRRTVAFDAGVKLPSPADLRRGGGKPGAPKRPASVAEPAPSPGGQAAKPSFDATALRREGAAGASSAAKKRRSVRATVAFDASEVKPPAPAAAVAAAPSAAAAKKSPASSASEQAPDHREQPASPDAPAAAEKPAGGGTGTGSPSAEPAGTGDSGVVPRDVAEAGSAASQEEPVAGWRLLSERQRDPTEDNPLRYRERLFVVPPGAADEQLERFLRLRLEEVQRTLADAPPGKFVNLAVFDHAWEEKPERPPLLILQWKDWRGAPVLQKPVPPSQTTAVQTAARAASVRATPPASQPPAPASGAGASSPARAARRETSEQENRLAVAFEACQDLLFLQTPGEGMAFVVRLLSELVPARAFAAGLYDINDDVFRVVAARGEAAEARQGKAIPAHAGFFGLAVSMPGAVLRLDDVAHHERFSAEVDTLEGEVPSSALYTVLEQQGALLGILQILDRQSRSSFDEDDEAVVRYVAEQASRFLAQARIRASRRRAT